jgi:Leucine-rich repeat (LRR) protein
MMMGSQNQHQPHPHRRRDSDELSETTSELASAIHASAFASSVQQMQLRPDGSSLIAQAGGGGSTPAAGATGTDGYQKAGPVQESSFVTPTASSPLSDDDAKQRGKTIVVVAVAAIIVAIAVVAYVAGQSNNNNDDRNSSQKLTIEQVIQGVSSNFALGDPNSPQHRARKWMMDVDQLTDVIIQEGLNRILQRYALATFYFATGGDQLWNHIVLAEEPPFDFINPATSECEWTGIVCATTDQPDENTVNANRRRRRRYNRRLLEDEETTATAAADAADAADAATAATTTTTKNINSTVFGLKFPHRNLTGVLPPELGTMSFLRSMDLSSNQLIGTIPDEAVMEKMINLWWLDLSDNRLTGTIPKSLWTLPKLSHLCLFRNQLKGKIERRTEQSSSTQSASSSSSTSSDRTTNAVADDAGGAASPIKPLSQVYLYENQLTGRIPSWFHELNGLERWLSYKNQLTGPLPEQQPEKLSFFDVSFNRLSGTIPATLWATYPPPPLEMLYLEHNRLTGTIPNSTELQLFIKLVSIHSNRLSGQIPEGFGLAWTNLVELRLHNNTITGTIPNSLWRDTQSPEKLTHINLSGNDLSGTLPASAQVRNLREVRLQANPKLGGTIPADFAYAWRNLSVLEIQDTSLVGQLGPVVESSSAGDDCSTVWPLYSEVITSFNFGAHCYRLFVTDPNPPVQCRCCTNCTKEKMK